MTSIAVVDTGPLVAAANRADPAHHACVEALKAPDYVLVIPALCVAEAVYLIGRRQGPQVEAAFLRGLKGFDVQAPTGAEWSRMGDLVEQYADGLLGGTDASVVSLAERLGTEILITLDRRHFATLNPRHCKRFRIVP